MILIYVFLLIEYESKFYFLKNAQLIIFFHLMPIKNNNDARFLHRYLRLFLINHIRQLREPNCLIMSASIGRRAGIFFMTLLIGVTRAAYYSCNERSDFRVKEDFS
jgi:hypothetical protein